jgi:hypothetical protein
MHIYSSVYNLQKHRKAIEKPKPKQQLVVGNNGVYLGGLRENEPYWRRFFRDCVQGKEA